MALLLQKPVGGYLRLNYEGPVGVAGTTQQSWDLTAFPKTVRDSSGFKNNLLVLARGLSADLTDVSAAVTFNPPTGTPVEMVLTVTAVAPTDLIALDVWCLNSIVGAISNSPKLYFIPAAASGVSPVMSVFGRVGAVVAAIGDYAFAQISGSIDDTQHGNRSGGALHAVVGAAAGFMSAADKTKLDGIAPGAQVNTVTSVFGRVGAVVAAAADYAASLVSNDSGVAGLTVAAALDTLAAAITALAGSTVPDTRTVTAGAGLTGGGDLSADRTFDVVANADGSIAVSANDVAVGVLATDAQHGLRGGGTQHADVVPAGASGFMTGADKTKLDGLSSTPFSSVLLRATEAIPLLVDLGGGDIANPAFDVTRDSYKVVGFDDTIVEGAPWQSAYPNAPALGAFDGYRINIFWSKVIGGTDGNVVWAVALERDRAGDSLGADNFAALQTAAAAANDALNVVKTVIEIVVPADFANIAPGDPFRLFVQRTATDAGDTMVGDAELLCVTVEVFTP